MSNFKRPSPRAVDERDVLVAIAHNLAGIGEALESGVNLLQKLYDQSPEGRCEIEAKEALNDPNGGF